MKRVLGILGSYLAAAVMLLLVVIPASAGNAALNQVGASVILVPEAIRTAPVNPLSGVVLKKAGVSTGADPVTLARSHPADIRMVLRSTSGAASTWMRRSRPPPRADPAR